MSEFLNEKNECEHSLSSYEVKCAVLHKEVSADFILPDYMGDIKRMLKYTANVVSCNKIVSLAEASFVAVVTFRVMYLDSEDTLTEATFSCDVELVEKLFGESNDANVDYKVQNVALRLNGPRKISAKATVTCEFCAAEEKIICERAGYPGAQMLKKDIMIHTVEYLKNSDFVWVQGYSLRALVGDVLYFCSNDKVFTLNYRERDTIFRGDGIAYDTIEATEIVLLLK